MSRKTRRRQPQFDEAGLPPHGAAWDEGTVLRARSRGPGIAVEVAAPFAGPIRRVVSGEGDAHQLGGKTFVTPRSALAGQEIFVVVEQ